MRLCEHASLCLNKSRYLASVTQYAPVIVPCPSIVCED